MPIAPQSFSLNFAQGLDTKTDPKQIQVGKFLSLENMIFQKGKLLQKRPGYGPLTSISQQNYLTTLNGNLTAISNTVSAYSSTLEKWITKGTLQPCSLNVLPLIRNNLSQTQCDTAISGGLILTVYTQTYNVTTGSITQYLFAIADVTTGQNIVEPTAIPAFESGTISGSPRAFVVGNYFLIVCPVTVSATIHLQYCSIPIANPVNSDNSANISSSQEVTAEVYAPITQNPGWDAVVFDNQLLIAYNSTTTAQGVHVATLTQQQIANNSASSTILQKNNAAYIGAIVSVCVDSTTMSRPVYYITFWNNSTTNGYTFAVTTGFGTITQFFAPTEVITSTAVANLASVAQNNLCTFFYEVTNAYSYDSNIPTNYVSGNTITFAASVGTAFVSARSIGLASKAFLISGTIYYLGAYQSTYQPSYFLMNGTLSLSSAPIVVATLANLNGNGYLTLGLPNVNISGTEAMLSYLYKDLVQSLNTTATTSQIATASVYSQEGVNLAAFDVGTTNIYAVETAKNLFLSGGYLGQYDGYLPVENNFFIWPDSVEATWTETSTVTPTGTASNGAKTIVVSSASGIAVGMTISDSTNPTYIPSGTTVTFVNGTTVTMSNAAAHAISGDTLSIQGNIAAVPSGATEGGQNYAYVATYEWTDNQGLPYRSQPSVPIFVTTSGDGTAGTITINVPTLRLTAKVANAVKIVIYRWSVNTEAYNQVTSIFYPILNNTTIDSISFVDTLPDVDIVGDNLLYTSGGVVADTAAPSTSIMCLFDSRLWLVDAEDPFTLWLSKTVVEGAPVEMSNNFTLFCAPTTGASASLGPITGIFPIDDKLIIFHQEGIQYINGTGPTNTGATSSGSPIGNYSQPTFITSIVGCTNQQSIVMTGSGLMFQSDKGIWLLDRGLGTTYIGSEVEAFNSYNVNSAQAVPKTNYVLFTLTGTNTTLMYDYYYSQWGTFTGPWPISSCIYQDLHTILDKYGNISQQTPGAYLDGTNPVLMSFVTGHIYMSGISNYQALFELQLVADYISPHFLNTFLGYDFGPLSDNVEIQPNNATGVYGSDPVYGETSPYGGPGTFENWRIQPSNQNCQAFQIGINEIYDPSQGLPAGAGFTLSAITCTVGLNKGYRPVKSSNTVGTT
jgi:hypothetical protein